MKTSSSSHTLTILGVVVGIVAILAYFYFQGSRDPGSSSALQVQVGGDDVGLATIRLLEQIQTVQIDSSFFSDPAYKALLDYSVAIPPQNVGRPNPFAPI